MERKDARVARDATRELIEPPEELNSLARLVLNAAIAVHRCLGPGFLEQVYEESLVLELDARGIKHQRQVRFPVLYRGRVVGDRASISSSRNSSLSSSRPLKSYARFTKRRCCRTCAPVSFDWLC
jgi:hypothetical protein